MLLQESFPLTTAFFDAVHKYGFSNISLTDLESMTGNSDESLLFKSQLNFIHTTDHQNVEIHPMAYTHYSYLAPQWYAPQTNPNEFIQLHHIINDWLEILRSSRYSVHQDITYDILPKTESFFNDLHDKLFHLTPYIYGHMPLLLPVKDGQGFAFYYVIRTWHHDDVQVRTQKGANTVPPHYLGSARDLSPEHLQMIDEGIDYVHHALSAFPKVYKFHIVAKVNLGLLSPQEHMRLLGIGEENLRIMGIGELPKPSIQWFDGNSDNVLSSDVVQHLEKVLHNQDGDTYLNSTQIILPREEMFQLLSNGVTNILALPSVDVLKDLQAKFQANLLKYYGHQSSDFSSAFSSKIHILPYRFPLKSINQNINNNIENHLLDLGFDAEHHYKGNANSAFHDYHASKINAFKTTDELAFPADKSYRYLVEELGVMSYRSFTNHFNLAKVQIIKQRVLVDFLNDLETDLSNPEAQAIIANNMSLDKLKDGFNAVRQAVIYGEIPNDKMKITSTSFGSALWVSNNEKREAPVLAFEVCQYSNYEQLNNVHTLHHSVVQPLRVLLQHMFVDKQSNMVSGFDLMAMLAIIKATTVTYLNQYQSVLEQLEAQNDKRYIHNGMSLKDVYTHRVNKLKVMEKSFPDPTIVPYWVELSDIKQYRIEFGKQDNIFNMNVFDSNNKKRKLDNGMDLYGKPSPIYDYVYSESVGRLRIGGAS